MEENKVEQLSEDELLELKEAKRKKIKKIIWIVIGTIVLLTTFSLYLGCRQIFGDEVGDAVLGKDVANGFIAIGNFFYVNAAAILYSLLTIGILIFVTFILTILINLIFRKTPRSRTIGSLLKSLVKYVNVIIGVCAILAIFGVNVYGIIAGLGIVGLIIGLGCKTLVNDIVSGFFIVVDNYFQVGEKIIVDGFTGHVLNIGLRTTKIKSWDGNIKCINNSLITSIVNLSRYGSKAMVKIDISFNEDLRRVEAIILRNLDDISKKIPELKSPLTYSGVDCLDDCGVCLAFCADVDEGNRVTSCRKITRELYLLFTDNDIIIPFKQLVINAPDPINKPRATKEDLELSNERWYKVNKKETSKKKNIISNLNKVVKESNDEFNEN